MPESQESVKAVPRWTSRAIPVLLGGVLGYGTYVVVARLCVDYLYRDRRETVAAVVVLVVYFIFFLLSLVSYLRTLWIVHNDTGLVPLRPGVKRPDPVAVARVLDRARRMSRGETDIEAWPGGPEPDDDPDSPGLEVFYSKSVFVCERDGRPRWCSACRNWKPDRAHHSSELARCVYKMDHYCPWVGGMISENSFKFFAQFVFYCTFMCAVALVVASYCLAQQQQEGRPVDGQVVAVIALAAFFGLFTLGMTLTAWHYISRNMTNVDMLKKMYALQLAVHVPLGTLPGPNYSTITYPLPKPDEDQTLSPRDRTASRTFAILPVDAEDNPWDLGRWYNWKAVMGHSVIEWVLPIRKSPCTRHDSMVSAYPVGPVLHQMARRHGIRMLTCDEDDFEMRQEANQRTN